MKVLLIDAFDSFVYMINNYYEKIGCNTLVIRVNENLMKVYADYKPDLVVLGPGPGTPASKGYLNFLRKLPSSQAVFGICLGHQAIGEYFGCILKKLSVPYHGKFSMIVNDGKGVFSGINSEITVVRYHSLIIECSDNNSDDLVVSAKVKGTDVVMGIRHKTRPIEGVQFHPESIGTENGIQIIKNSLNLIRR